MTLKNLTQGMLALTVMASFTLTGCSSELLPAATLLTEGIDAQGVSTIDAALKDVFGILSIEGEDETTDDNSDDNSETESNTDNVTTGSPLKLRKSSLQGRFDQLKTSHPDLYAEVVDIVGLPSAERKTRLNQLNKNKPQMMKRHGKDAKSSDGQNITVTVNVNVNSDGDNQGQNQNQGRFARGGNQGQNQNQGRFARGGNQGQSPSQGRVSRSGNQGQSQNQGRFARGGNQAQTQSKGRFAPPPPRGGFENMGPRGERGQWQGRAKFEPSADMKARFEEFDKMSPEERAEKMQAGFEEHLKALKETNPELAAKLEALKDLSPEERQEKMKSLRDEFKPEA